jgi:hypothetical protein
MNIPQSDTVVHIASVNFFKVCQFHFLNFLFYLDSFTYKYGSINTSKCTLWFTISQNIWGAQSVMNHFQLWYIYLSSIIGGKKIQNLESCGKKLNGNLTLMCYYRYSETSSDHKATIQFPSINISTTIFVPDCPETFKPAPALQQWTRELFHSVCSGQCVISLCLKLHLPSSRR